MKGSIMNEEKKCLRCGGTNLEASYLQSTGKVYARPNSANLTGLLRTGAPLDALTCLDCGHVELIVDTNKAKSFSTVT
jgi:predicted nucleic-acid-binding Zn-ribbon protein